MNYTVFILNPNLIAREGISRIIESEGFKVVFACSGADEIPTEALSEVHLGLIDVADPVEQIRSVKSLRMLRPCKIIVLADTFDMPTMLECFSQGADGYILKNMPCSTLIASLRLAVLGHKLMPSELSDRLSLSMMASYEAAPQPTSDLASEKLTEREHDVLKCLVSGDANKIISRKLEVSEATVKVHVKSILRKLNVLNRTQAAIWGKSHGVGGVA